MTSIIEDTWTLHLKYNVKIDTDTGEVVSMEVIDRVLDRPGSPKRSTPPDNEVDPKLYLEDNKFRLNSAAVSIMNLGIDDKVDIKYENGLPVIGTDNSFGTKGGNKVTKSNTVAYRGKKNEELSKHGNEFTLVAHPSKEGLFVLTSDSVKVEALTGDENVRIDEDEEVSFPTDMGDFIEDKDAEVTEIDSNFFKL